LFHRRALFFRARAALGFGARFFLIVRFRFAPALRPTRSGNAALPVSRFHSSKVSGEILPFTSSSANFLRCALLLNGIQHSECALQSSATNERMAGPESR